MSLLDAAVTVAVFAFYVLAAVLCVWIPARIFVQRHGPFEADEDPWRWLMP